MANRKAAAGGCFTWPLVDNHIPAPPGIGLDSRMEALIRATADIEADGRWAPTHIELCRLYAGRHEWSTESSSWQSVVATQITLITEGGPVVEIQVDGEPTGLQQGSQAFKLMVAVSEMVSGRDDGLVDVAELANDQEIWGPSLPDEARVRRCLSNLKLRHLRYSVDLAPRRPVRLKARVVRQEK